MSARTNLLRSVSVAAMLLAGAPAAKAEFANGLPQYYFSAEGGLIITDPAITVNTDGLAEDKLGTFDLDESLGGYGAAQFGMFVTNDIDWRVGGAYSRFADNDSSESFEDGSLFADLGSGYKWQYATADLDFGYHPQMPAGTDVRLFAGARGLYSDESADKVGNFGDDLNFLDAEFTQGSEFFGGGPRFGAEFETRGGGNWGLSGMIAGAVLFGERTTDFSADVELGGSCPPDEPLCSIISGSDSESENATVYNLDAAIGVDYYVMDQSKFTFGVRAQQFWNLRSDDFEGNFKIDEDSLVWGPFFKFVHRM